jgi:cytochrome P450
MTITASRAAGASASDEAWDLLQAIMTTDEGKQRPEQYFAALHRLGEDIRLPDGNHLVLSHSAVNEVFRNPHFLKASGASLRPAYTKFTPDQDAELLEIAGNRVPLMTALDPPIHTRMRALVQHNFTPRHVKALEDIIPTEINRLLDQLDATQPLDIISSFSARFAPEIMARLVGLPLENRGEISRLSTEFQHGADPGVDFQTRKKGLLAARRSCELVREVIEDRRKCPRDDLVSALTLAGTGKLSEPELESLLHVMYLGGYETTAHMVGNGLVLLLNHPEQLERLRADNRGMKGAVNEILRMSGAISMSKVVATEGATLRGKPADMGRDYLLLFAAANRDPKVFPDPDRFDISRSAGAHLSFGGGPHYCLGANLARYELEKVFEIMIARYPRMQLLDPAPARKPTVLQRAYAAVPILLEPAQTAGA